jgi:predicted O-methyltransferase YrrM
MSRDVAARASGERTISLLDQPRVADLLARLHALSDRQARFSLPVQYLRRRLRSLLVGAPMDWDRGGRRKFMGDKLVALDPDKARLCYLLCRAAGANRVVEVGTSFGVSTIYLAAAVREDMDQTGRPGTVIGTEWEPTKAAAAREHLTEAGLNDVVEIREGDLRETLKDVGGLVDFVLMDVWVPMARPALELLIPQLQRGAVIICDNVTSFRREYREYLALVRDPGLGFRSLTLPHKGGVELSVWLP